METIQFLDNDGTFSVKQPENHSYLYFPIAGEKGIKSSLTPGLGGDIKWDQNTFLMEPVSVENLHNNRSGRNFWCHIEGEGAWSITGASAEEESKKFSEDQDQSELTAGFMWQSVRRQSEKYEMNAEVVSFVPCGYNVEIMYVEICNAGTASKKVTPIAAVPVFGRSADNIRDHRHVTSLLHRIKTTEYGVYVKPTLSFDERGHRENNLTYFVCGITGKGEKPESFYPVAEEYIGEGGSYTQPWKVMKNEKGVPSGSSIEGKEALGGIRFLSVELDPGESMSYTVIMGVTECENEVEGILADFDSAQKVKKARAETSEYWQSRVNVRYETGDSQFDNLVRWISFQPILRRIYGCSFLPHHDYGRGGRGWRDLWQDCLSLLIMDPGGVRKMILDNYNGVRIDGTNATIIGEKSGEFVADRNGIARVWMDHGVWPFMTTKFYIDQTGDIGILREKAVYFKDEQIKRGTDLDSLWDVSYGIWQKCEDCGVYEGTVLEHLLLQHLCAFYEVGGHNHIRLRGADWNDALDMAAENGESVAFTCAYAGNMLQLAELLQKAEEKYGWKQAELLEEIAILLEDDAQLYDSVDGKQEILDRYLMCCRHQISGRKIMVPMREVVCNLKHKAEWIQNHVRRMEWIETSGKEGWFNSYYDNDGQSVEGIFSGGVRMMLTGQVFAIMSGTATADNIVRICNSADHYLYVKEIGGYRLNTNFHELKFNLGRMFGFAYGEKENGAVFSHMAVMYANALYQRGFVTEGNKALEALAYAALNFKTSRIYPGIPEYFNASGRGLYNYLTGAASWYMLTMVTEVFGVHGKIGDMVITPKLLEGQFDKKGNAGIHLWFSGKEFQVVYRNPMRLSYGDYAIKSARCDGIGMEVFSGNSAVLRHAVIKELPEGAHRINIDLERRKVKECDTDTLMKKSGNM